jgi:tetratricopeptide (TPR) repeat protein
MLICCPASPEEPREYNPSKNIRIAIASRNPPGSKWDGLRNVSLTIPLDIFSEQEAEEFLDAYGINHLERRAEILDISGRLPVLMSWLAAPEADSPEPSVSSQDIVERFLRWVTGPTQRRDALLAAIPRSFNLDTVSYLLEKDDRGVDSRTAFEWLQTMPFVQTSPNGWHYHPVVRLKILYYLRQESPKEYRQMHARLAHFYDKQRTELKLSEEDQWAHRNWRLMTLAYIYHHLVENPHKHWVEVMSLFAVALRQRRAFAEEIIELLSFEDVRDELTSKNNSAVILFRQKLKAIKEGSLKDGYEMFDMLCGIERLSKQARAYALAYRGYSYQRNESYENALLDFNLSNQLNPNDAWNLALRGTTHRATRQYHAALADLNLAIELKPNDEWTLGNRGITYRLMEQYDAALSDFNRVIELNTNAAWVFAQRGSTYRLMEQYDAALADFNRAIELNPNDAWAIAQRGNSYHQMGQYHAALADFNRAIELNPNDAWAFGNRGDTYRQMGQYHAALADFNHAIELTPNVAWIFANRGFTYRKMGQYDAALADINHAIELEPNYDWALYDRALTNSILNRTTTLDIHDLSRAIALVQAKRQNKPNHCQIAFNLALYLLAAGKLTQADAEYSHLETTCSSRGELQASADDLFDMHVVHSDSMLVLKIRDRLLARIAKLTEFTQGSSTK